MIIRFELSFCLGSDMYAETLRTMMNCAHELRTDIDGRKPQSGTCATAWGAIELYGTSHRDRRQETPTWHLRHSVGRLVGRRRTICEL